MHVRIMTGSCRSSTLPVAEKRVSDGSENIHIAPSHDVLWRLSLLIYITTGLGSRCCWSDIARQSKTATSSTSATERSRTMKRYATSNWTQLYDSLSSVLLFFRRSVSLAVLCRSTILTLLEQRDLARAEELFRKAFESNSSSQQVRALSDISLYLHFSL